MIPGIDSDMECRAGCGACCIGLSISSPIPGMPLGKPAGVRCVQLSEDNLCRIFGQPERPEVCVRLRPMKEMCGSSSEEALVYLAWLEDSTKPAGHHASETALACSAAGRTGQAIPAESGDGAARSRG